jgi:hypothetical protein
MTEKISTNDIEALVAAANPLDPMQADRLPLAAVQAELREALLTEPAAGAVATGMPFARRRHGARWGLLPRLTGAFAVVVLAAVGGLWLAGGSGGRSGTAWGAELVRFANASPLVLLEADGWHVAYADEESEQEGELHFRRGPAPPDDASIVATASRDVPSDMAQLNWRTGSLTFWMRDRAASARVRTLAPVLGTTAHVYQYDGGRPGHEDITALWRYDGRVMEFRAGAPDVEAFKAVLASLRRVDTDAWLSALPASVVKAADRPGVIAEMLKGVAVPPGFDPSAIRGADLTKDRYQLGAAVVGTVSCTWLKRWSDARASGDAAGVRAAIDAMKTAKHWPIVKEMATSGAYPQVLETLVAAMPSGRYYGRPLEGDADPALGCPQLGIPLAAPGDRVNGG